MGSVTFGQATQAQQALRAYELITTTTSGSIAIPAGAIALRKMVLGVSEDATLAAAGITQFTLTCAGTTVFSEGFFLPSAPGSQAGEAYHRDIPFDEIAFRAPAGSTCTWTLSAAMTAGQMDINLYFS